MRSDGGAGLIVYNRKEGRALGEVTKFLVYNARKRQEGGDQAATYFERTECVAGVQDARFQQLMPDVLHWLGITRIDRFVSMSNMSHDAITETGIEIGERVQFHMTSCRLMRRSSSRPRRLQVTTRQRTHRLPMISQRSSGASLTSSSHSRAGA